jgi:sporulation protein YlmC with PRC-barrel domain
MESRGWPTFVRLGPTAPLPDDWVRDLRGRRVFDRAGVEIGVVDDLLFDDQERRLRLFRIKIWDPLAPDRHVLIPVDAISRLDGDRIDVDLMRERVLGAPLDDPDAPQTPDHWDGLYDFYGATPFWNETGSP